MSGSRAIGVGLLSILCYWVFSGPSLTEWHAVPRFCFVNSALRDCGQNKHIFYESKEFIIYFPVLFLFFSDGSIG